MALSERGAARLLLRDKFADPVLDRAAAQPGGALPGRGRARKEVLEREDSPAALQVFLIDRPADRRFMNRKVVGDIPQPHRHQIAVRIDEEGPLPPENRLDNPLDGDSSAFDRLDHPEGLRELLADILFGLRVILRHLKIGAVDRNAGVILPVVGADRLAVNQIDGYIRQDVGHRLIPEGRGGARVEGTDQLIAGPGLRNRTSDRLRGLLKMAEGAVLEVIPRDHEGHRIGHPPPGKLDAERVGQIIPADSGRIEGAQVVDRLAGKPHIHPEFPGQRLGGDGQVTVRIERTDQPFQQPRSTRVGSGQLTQR